jgi:hypothetical protein
MTLVGMFGPSEIKGLQLQTSLFAPIEVKGISGALTNPKFADALDQFRA